MPILLLIIAAVFGGLAIAGLMVWGMISLLLLLVSALCLVIAWKLRPRRARPAPPPRP